MRRTRLPLRIRTLMVVIAAAALACMWEAERRYVARWKASLAIQAAPPMLGDRASGTGSAGPERTHARDWAKGVATAAMTPPISADRTSRPARG